MLVLFIPVLICICKIHTVKDQYPHNWMVLLLFTTLSAVDLGVFCTYFYAAGYGGEILLAFGITLAIFCALTLFTMQSRIDCAPRAAPAVSSSPARAARPPPDCARARQR